MVDIKYTDTPWSVQAQVPSVLFLTIHTDLEVQAENENENLEEDNACLAEVFSKGVFSQIILYLPLKMATIFILPY